MKHSIIIALMLGMSTGAFAQTEPVEPCCSIVGINPATNTITGWNKTNGRLFQFNVNATDIKTLKLNSPVNATPQLDRITGLNGAAKNYSVIKTFAEPVGKPVINKAEPVGVVNLQIDNVEPCCAITELQIDNSEPVNTIVTASNKTTGKSFQFKAASVIAKTLQMGDPVYLQPVNGIRLNYAEPINDFAIVQSTYGSSGQMNSYGYSATSDDETTGNGNATDKWVITPVPTMKGVLGKLNTNFSEGADWSIDIRTAAGNKFITNRSGYSKHGPLQDIAPGTYNFRLNTILVENVPIEKGKETRLKAGYLNIVSEGGWNLYDESKKKFQTSGNKPKKIALPVGNYQLKLGGQFFPVVIKDKETVEY